MSRFRPPWWARNPHVQTIAASLAPGPRPTLRQEIFELPDGDFLELGWRGTPAAGKPLVVLLHGLEGSAESPYIRRMIAVCAARGLAAVAVHHRGCGRRPNRKPRAYHSGDTADVALVFDALARRWPESPLWAAGYSLGGNMLVKYLGERGADTPIAAGAAVSAPLRLAVCTERMSRGFSRVYQKRLLDELRVKMADKLAHPELGPALPFDAEALAAARTFRAFDDLVTARLHGFDDADDYYARSSGMQFLPAVERPLLILHAADDPFMTAAVIPDRATLPPSVTYELARHGGHLGFIEGGRPWRPRFYLERRLLAFFDGQS